MSIWFGLILSNIVIKTENVFVKAMQNNPVTGGKMELEKTEKIAKLDKNQGLLRGCRVSCTKNTTSATTLKKTPKN